MPQPDRHSSGWRAVVLIAATYIYFLIFAQFAFLKRLAELGIADVHLKAVMGAMAAGGILFSLLAPRANLFPSAQQRMRVGLLACGVASALSLLPLGLAGSILVACLIGCSLGLLTVTLVTHLRSWLGSSNPLLKVGLGTGIGYLACNFPPFFTASPQVQAITSSLLCAVCVFIPLRSDSPRPEEQPIPGPATSFVRVLVCFTALVWFDSAAFFIIQNTPALKAGTWQGSLHLWLNGVLHLLAALASAWFLLRRGLPFVLASAFLALASACLLLLDPSRAMLASVFYPIGVSLYSVVLVAYPSLLAPVATMAECGRQAGWIYAIAGWLGSAMGIGMGQHLGHVPVTFVVCAGVLILTPQLLQLARTRRREVIATCAVLVAAYGIDRVVIVHHRSPVTLSPAQRGRQVYISEGCIHCHSQYVRPNSPDVLMWGPVQTIDELRREHPPLIGNRRQGPDLAEVGNRRSPLWLKAHLYDPSQLSPGSFMPSYAYLFRDQRGNELVAYLSSLNGEGTAAHRAAEKAWVPSSAAMAEAGASEGKRLIRRDCSTCHDPDGSTRKTWASSFKPMPPNLTTGPFQHLSASEPEAQLRDHLARIAKFGIPGTDMPGHEYLSDQEIASISFWLAQNIQLPVRSQRAGIGDGEKK